MGRGAFAFRDLDEELQSFVDDNSVVHVYQSHSSPPSLRTEALKPKPGNLSDSMVLKRYVDHHKAQRRRKLLGGALFVGVALLGSVPVLMMEAQKGELQSPLELALAAPYKALRVRGEILRPRGNTGADLDEEADHWIVGPNVGDFDPHDDGTSKKTPAAGVKEEEEADEDERVDEEDTEEAERRGDDAEDSPLESLEEMLTGRIIKVLREQEVGGEQREMDTNT